MKRNFVLDKESDEALNELAELHERSRSQELRFLIKAERARVRLHRRSRRRQPAKELEAVS